MPLELRCGDEGLTNKNESTRITHCYGTHGNVVRTGQSRTLKNKAQNQKVGFCVRFVIRELLNTE